MVNLKYALAILVALNILFIAFSAMNYLDLQRLLHFTNDLTTFSAHSQDVEASMLMLQDSNQSGYCAILDQTYREKTSQTNQLMERMLTYERANLFQEFYALKTNFLLTNLQLWRLSRMEKQYCSSSHQDLLYVYSSRPDCYACQVMGQIIDNVRPACNVRVFVMDNEQSLASASIIKSKYNITSAPTLIVNDRKYEGVQTEAELKKTLGCG